MSQFTSSSEPSVSVTYGTAYAGLFYQKGKEINYASLDRAGELVAQMPFTARKTLLAPIEQGLIDPQSVFYLIDDKSENQIAICVEDFVHLASTCFSNESDHEQQHSSYVYSSEGDYPIPPRLLDALLLQSEADEMYSSIDNESSSGYSSHGDQTRSRGNSATSQRSISSTLPILPESRPPFRSLSVSAVSHITQQNPECASFDGLGNCYLPSENFTRKIPAPVSIATSSSFGSVYTTPIHPKKISLSSFVENIGTSIQGFRARNSRLPACRFQLLIIICAGLTFAALATGVYFLLKFPHSKESLARTTASPIRGSNETYDCVNGSTYKILLDHTLYPLVDLKIPELYPTLIVGSLEYLLVSNLTQWFYAQKYCTAWCGYLVSIKGPEENAMILALELAKEHLKDFTSFWIGLKAWSNKWYLDDESNATYFNFADPTQTNQNIIGINNELMGCVQSNGSGLWSILDCQAMLPFVCERNTADPNIQHTPFAPYQEQPCQNAGGACKVDNDCGTDSHQISHLCPEQPNNILCCIPNTSSLTPPPPLNSTVKTCADAGGICNHVEADQCRGGFVVFDLPKPCPDEPRPYGCCIENEHFA